MKFWYFIKQSSSNFWSLCKGVWRDPVWSKVISGLILAIGGAFWYWFEFLKPLFFAASNYMLQVVSVPLWLFLAMSLVCVVFVLVFFFNLCIGERREEWEKITCFNLEELGCKDYPWKVEWENLDYQSPGNIKILCARCGYELDFPERQFEMVTAVCRWCGYRQQLNISLEVIYDFIEKLIQKAHREAAKS